MAGSQSNFQILDHLYQDLCSSYIKSDAWTEFSMANFTPRIIFSSHNMNDFTMYTYNKKAPMTGLDTGPVMALSGLAP